MLIVSVACWHQIVAVQEKLQPVWWTFPVVPITYLLSPALVNFGNIKMLFMILKPKFMEPEVGVVIRY